MMIRKLYLHSHKNLQRLKSYDLNSIFSMFQIYNVYICTNEWVKIAQSCLTFCSSMDCSPPGSSVLGILQARILKWVSVPFSRGSSWPRDQTQVSCIAGRFFTIWATREALYMYVYVYMYIYAYAYKHTHTYNGFITWSILRKFSHVLYGRRNNDFFQGSMETYCSCFTCLIAKAGLLKQGRRGVMWFLDWGMSANVDGTDQQQRPTVGDRLETQASMCVQFLLPARQVEQNKGWYSEGQLAHH